MKPRFFKRENIYKIIIVLALILTITASVYAIINGRHYFSRRNLRQLENEIKSFGIWSPLAIFGIIFLDILIPPLPIPIPLVEIIAGVILGFWPGAILIWVTQLISSITAFSLSKRIGKFFINGIMKNRIFGFYQQFIKKRGTFAVFVIRATMSAPFSISYMAGLMQMNALGFTVAILLGAIPEVVIFVYLGTLIQQTHIRLWYILITLVILGTIPLIVLLTSKIWPKRSAVDTHK